MSALSDRREPRFDRAGDFLSVDGILRSLDVVDAPKARQRAAIAEASRRPGIAALLAPLRRELEERDLL